MNSMYQRTRSIWMAEQPDAPPEIRENLETDVAIVGAGIGGLTTAYLLAQEGKKVVVVDAGGGGMTALTTAHLTCALDDRWHALLSLRGEQDARLAASAHQGAIDLVAKIAQDGKIDCDFAVVDGFLVPVTEKDRGELKKELEACHLIGLQEVTLEERSPYVAYHAGPCLRFPHQARFHPLKYLRGLIAGIEKAGGMVRAGHVTAVESGDRPTVKLANGREVRAGAAVIATNTPINDRVMMHTKLASYRSYVIAGHVPKGSVPDALLWDTGWPYHYVRIQPAGERDVLIVGGEDHKTGQADDMTDRLDNLETWTRERFPMMERVMWRWSGQVMESVDFLGYLGRNPGKDKNVYIVTGDSGQGMTHCTIGAKIITDEIVGRNNDWATLFDPARKTVKAAGTYAKENLNVAGQMADHLTSGDVASADDIPRGSGAVVRQGTQKIAAYRDDDGVVTACSAVCPHLGCVVAWNGFEKCWDCPCHGSQFSATGEVFNGPATGNLPPAELEEGKAPRQKDAPIRPDVSY